MQRRALASVCAVLFLTFLDNTVISVALADVQSTLHPGITALQWIVDGYMLAFAALMLTGGTLGDLLGRRAVMLAGLTVFCAGSVICALSSSPAMLIVGRVVMGVGAAASEPGTLSVLRHLFPDSRERARAVGVWTAVSGAALALGPILGGLIIQISDWRGVFWFNLTFGAVAFAAAALTIPETSDPHGRRLDPPGLGLGAGTVIAATFAIIDGETAGYRTWWVELLFAVALVCGAALVFVERRVIDPVLKLELFRRPGFSTGNLVAFVANWGVFAVFFFTSLYLQLIANFSPATIVLQFLAMAAAMGVAAATGSFWIERYGARPPMTGGCLLAGAGLLLVNGALNPNVGVGRLAWSLAIVGIGLGLALVAMTAAVINAAPAQRSGMAASTVNTSRELGGVFGVAILGSILNHQITRSLAHKLVALGIPVNFRAIVISAVTHGGVPKSAGAVPAGTAVGAAQGHAKLVNAVIRAAENSFADGLHLSLTLAAALLLAAAALVLATLGHSHARSRHPRRACACSAPPTASETARDTARPGARPTRRRLADPSPPPKATGR